MGVKKNHGMLEWDSLSQESKRTLGHLSMQTDGRSGLVRMFRKSHTRTLGSHSHTCFEHITKFSVTL